MKLIHSKTYDSPLSRKVSLSEEFASNKVKKNNPEHIHQFELAPNDLQLSKLDAVFKGPEIILSLLNEKSPSIHTNGDASLFLLENKKIIDPYLSNENRSAAVDFLSKLVHQWSKSLPKDVVLNFSDNCSISVEGMFYFPIPKLALLAPKNVNKVLAVTKNCRYKKDFSLIKTGKSFFVKIVTITSVEKLNHSNQVTFTNHKANLTYNDFISIFDAVTTLQLKNELKLSQSYAKPDFSAIE